MLPIDSFQPPTDSVYKFVALTGIVLLLACGALYWHTFRTFSEKLTAAKLRGRILAKKCELIISWNRDMKFDHPDPLRARDEAIELACNQEEHEVLTDEVEELSKALKRMHRILPLIIIVSGVLAFGGFSRWYYRVQVFQDRILAAEAESIEANQTPNKAPEPTPGAVTPRAAESTSK